ncbi:MAG TPA: DUF4062 domain-containing protein, partial [Candidatus Angelobacter sp.]|nr:DUF4062 domain-containing protein [Candidatus Angelobacter sp.]
VFISSTFRDLAEHREVLRLAIETSGHQFRGMEHFAADDRPPLDVALEAMNDCDVCVVIIGDLYGSSPPGRVRSYTELEYRRAEELGLPLIALVVADDAQVNRLHVERDEAKRDRLERLRSNILRSHTVETFRDTNEAAWKVLAALRTLETKLREDAEAGE